MLPSVAELNSSYSEEDLRLLTFLSATEISSYKFEGSLVLRINQRRLSESLQARKASNPVSGDY